MGNSVFLFWFGLGPLAAIFSEQLEDDRRALASLQRLDRLLLTLDQFALLRFSAVATSRAPSPHNTRFGAKQ